MNVLFPIDTATKHPTNPYLIQLLEMLSIDNTLDQVMFGAEVLHWDPSAWDVLHFQWPEAFFSWRKPSPKEYARAELHLLKHKQRGVVVTTVHNHEPKPDFEEMGSKVFDLVYGNTDCFIHLGQSSLKEFSKRFKNKRWYRSSNHIILYHGDYNYYGRFISDSSIAATTIKFPGTKVLVFGALRNPSEELLAREAFRSARLGKDSVLIYAGVPSRSKIPKDIIDGKHDADYGNVVRFHKRISDEQIKPLFESVDVVLIPRTGRLNSGVIPLAFTYGKPVVAPKEGVLEEMIQNDRGFLYTPGDSMHAARRLAEASSLMSDDLTALQERIHTFRRNYMSWAKISRSHASVYKRLVSQRNRQAKPNNPGSVKSDLRQTSKLCAKICFSIALNGYDSKFRSCIDSQKRYCLRWGYKYWCLNFVPWTVTAKQCAWLKVELMRGLLSAGFDLCGYLDADCEIRPHTPAFDNIFTGNSTFAMARGKSERLNSGIMFGKNNADVVEFLNVLIANSDTTVPKADRTAYENGHFIHFGRNVNFIYELDHFAWNNNTRLDVNSYVQHYSGGELRQWWETNRQSDSIEKAKPKRNNQLNEDLSDLPISEFLSRAKAAYEPFYAKLLDSNRKLVA